MEEMIIQNNGHKVLLGVISDLAIPCLKWEIAIVHFITDTRVLQ